MSASATPAGASAAPTAATPTGNTYDKYGSTNPIEQKMMAGFMARLDAMLDGLQPRHILEIGVGEGHVMTRVRERFPDATLVGLDLPDPTQSGPWSTQPSDHRGPAPNHDLHQVELAAVIRSALDQLNDRQRMAIVLNKFEDMNYAEIGEVMGLTTKAVKSLLSRARERLRELLQPYIYMDAPPPPDLHDDSDESDQITEGDDDG